MRMNKEDLKPIWQKHHILLKFYIGFNIVFFPITASIDLWRSNWKDVKDGFTILCNSLIGRWSK